MEPPEAGPNSENGQEKPEEEGGSKSPSPNKLFFKDLPERLKKILIDLEHNYKAIKQEHNGIILNIKILEKFERSIFNNYDDLEAQFLTHLFNIIKNLRKKAGYYLPYRAILNHYYSFFPEEVRSDSNISTGKKNQAKEKKTRGIRGGPPPHSSSKWSSGADSDNYISIRNIPLYRVADEIQGEIYKKNIYISKHSEEHFSTLTAQFDLARNKQDIKIYQKIERHFGIEYNKFGWATPIGKEEQAKLGICFTVQMHQKGRFTIFIKKNFKDVETFLEHYYRVFDFLDYEEHGRILDLFYLQKTNKKAFDLVHLTNKIGPKKVIDKDFKGSHIQVRYFTLKSGKKVIDVKIDYSDPHEPELEIMGPEAESKNLRDILVKPSETLPTINNIGYWSFEARKNTKGILLNQEIIQDTLNQNGNALLLVQKKLDGQYNDIMGEFTKQEILQDIHFLKLENFLQDSFKKGIGILDGINNNVGSLGSSIRTLYDFVDQGLGDVKSCFINQIDPIIEGLSFNSQKIDETSKRIENLNQNLDKHFRDLKSDLKEFIKNELSCFRKKLVNNLYLVLKAIHDSPNITSRELIKELRKELGVSKSTLYNYLRELREKGFIDYLEINNNRRGRSIRAYFIARKIKDFLKNLKKS
ncbi:MAG: hypothetical protein ACTSRP_20820 [Candidatus Helarchaeota archaeon]